MPLSDPRTVVHRSARRRVRLALWLVGANAVTALLLGVLVWQVLHATRSTAEGHARDVSAGLASVATLNVDSELGRIDAVLRATAAEIERLLADGVPDGTLDEVLRQRFALMDGIEALRLSDADGQVRWGTGVPAGAPVQIADRPYFRDAPRHGGRTVLAGPLQSRVSGNWILAFVRAVQVDGRFAGVIYISIGTEHFRRLFERYGLEALDSVTLRRDDLQLVAHLSPGSAVQGRVGDRAISAELRQQLAADARQGSVSSRVVLDGQPRTTSYRALPSWPLVVYAGVSDERFLEPWRRQAVLVASLGGLVWLIGALGSWFVFRAHARSDLAVQGLADQNESIRALLRVAADGIHIVDGRGRLVEMSDSFVEMLRSTREGLLGRHISSWDVHQDEADIAHWLSKVRVGDRQRVDVQHRRDDGEVIDVELHMSVTEVGGQLLVFSSGRDVTQIRRMVREQAAMLETDLVGIARIAQRRITWHNAAMARIFGYGRDELAGLSMRALYASDADFEALGQAIYPALRGQSQYRSQVRMRRKDGEAVWVDFGAARLSEDEIFVMAVDITILKEAHDALAHAAFHDPLTQLPNRALLYDRIEQALSVAARDRQALAVGYLDLDGFKAVKDGHGHDAGDHLLREIARRLTGIVRPADTVARMGGDEFVILLTSLSDGEWQGIFERLLDAVEQPLPLPSGAVVRVGATIGVALSGQAPDATPFELVERADHVMLQGKRSGKGRVVLA
jgi:diguanylate cyclase (GGDEF)-like protein/PAS domain S-box-containing protein